MNWKKISACVCFLAMTGMNVNAEVIDRIEEKNVDGSDIKSVSVYGQLPEIKTKTPMKNQVTLEVLYPGMDENSFVGKDKNEVVKYMAQTTADGEGKYEFDFTMDGVSGKYLIRIGYFGGVENGQGKINYDYVSPAEFTELFQKIDEALSSNDGGKLKEVIDDFTERGIITIDKYEELKAEEKDVEGIFDYMVKLEKIGDIPALNDAFSEGYACIMAEETENLGDIIGNEELNSVFGISEELSDMYSDLPEAVQNKIFSTAKEKLDSKDEFLKSLIRDIIKNTFEDILWQEVYGKIYDNNNLFSIDFSDYDSLSKKKQEYALKYFVDNSDKAVDTESVKELFEQSVGKGKAYKEPSKGSGGGGGGGSSVTGSGTMSSVSPVVTEKIDDGLYVAPVFVDLDGVEWAREAIEALSENKIVNGKAEGKFFPNDTVKREEFVKMIVEMFELYGDFYTSEFIDVDDSAWYSEYIIAASENGIINGISPYEFGVGQNIKRKDMAVIIYRILKSEGVMFENEKSGFSDVSPDYAESAIAGLAEKKIMKGMSDDIFEPEKHATRAEAAVLMYNVMKYLK